MGKSKPIYRVAKRLDCGGILEVNQASLPVVYSRFEWDEMVANKLTFIVTLSAQVIGYMACDRTGCIMSFAILEPFRRQGYGQNLMKFGITELKKTGLKTLILRVKVNNEPAQKLYTSLGFQIESTLNNYYGTDDHAYLMKLNL